MGSESDRLALIYQPHSYVRRGPPESCVQLVSRYAETGLATEMMVVRARASLPPSIVGREAIPGILRRAPWTAIKELGVRLLDRQFMRRLRTLNPDATIIEIWPGWPSPVVAEAQRLGFTVVRTMINCACATSRPILEDAFQRQRLPSRHNVTEQLVQAETAELLQYDYIFSSNDEVDGSLRAIGIPDERILKTSFGWDSKRFEGAEPAHKETGKLRFLFVGSVGVRKGIPELLAAWKEAAIANGELLIVGDVEDAFAERFATLPEGVRHLAFSTDIGGIYRSSDVFVFPTLEEGGPQVVYEAAGCGAAVITTPMGQARLFANEVNGLVVPPADIAALAAAMRRLADDPALLSRLKAAGQEGARAFDYAVVGVLRAKMLHHILDRRGRQPSAATGRPVISNPAA